MKKPTRFQQMQALHHNHEHRFPADDRARADAIRAYRDTFLTLEELWSAEASAYRGRNEMISHALYAMVSEARADARTWSRHLRDVERRAVVDDRAELVAAGLLDPDAALGANLRTEVTR